MNKNIMQKELVKSPKVGKNGFTEIKIADFDEIIYCKAEGNYTRIYFHNTSFLVTKVLKHFEASLPPGAYFRIHKSFLVNTKYISCCKSSKIILMKINVEIPIARRRRTKLLKELSKNHLLIGK